MMHGVILRDFLISPTKKARVSTECPNCWDEYKKLTNKNPNAGHPLFVVGGAESKNATTLSSLPSVALFMEDYKKFL